VFEIATGRYEVDAAASPALTAALAAWLADRDATLTDLQTGRSLEEAYLSLVGDTAADAPAADAGPGHHSRRSRRPRDPRRAGGTDRR
jgi:hypothetical protein